MYLEIEVVNVLSPGVKMCESCRQNAAWVGRRTQIADVKRHDIHDILVYVSILDISMACRFCVCSAGADF